MDYCRSVLAVAGANFRRLKRDARVWFIFVFTALLIHYYLRPVINYVPFFFGLPSTTRS